MKITLDSINQGDTPGAAPRNELPIGRVMTIVNIDGDDVWVNDDSLGMVEVPYDIFNFRPAINDQIKIFSNGDKHVATLVEAPTQGSPNINIVNNNESSATNINQNINAGIGFGVRVRQVSKIAYLLAVIFGGWFGIHRFMRGKHGLLYLLTFGLFGMGATIDIVIAIVKFINTDGSYFYFDAGGNWVE